MEKMKDFNMASNQGHLYGEYGLSWRLMTCDPTQGYSSK